MVGSDQSGTYPILILRNDVRNYFDLTVVVINSRRGKINLPPHVLPEDVPGLAPTSLLLEQIRTVDHRRLWRIYWADQQKKDEGDRRSPAISVELRSLA